MKHSLQIVTLSFLLTACNLNSNTPASHSEPNNTDNSLTIVELDHEPSTTYEMSGIWNSSYQYSFWVTDISYIHITDDGNLTIYNYLNDSFDKGNNCYDTSTFSLSSVTDKKFLLSNDDSSSVIEVDFWTNEKALFKLPIGDRVFVKSPTSNLRNFQPTCERKQKTFNLKPTLTDIAGLWDHTKIRPKSTKHLYSHYLLIDETGTHTTYWKDNKKQCYYPVGYQGLFVDLGEGDYENYTSNGELYTSFLLTLINNNLYFKTSDNEQSVLERVTLNTNEVISPKCSKN
ncbi:MAG: hypothetical protein ACI9OH_000616 [Oleispira sp.]|jgi:hypothetical protein